jgi:5-oxoprolinase (ATP-hydrolysing)
MSSSGDGKFHFCIDRGGTFTDVHCVLPGGEQLVTKLLSEDPMHYPDAPTEGIRRLLSKYTATGTEYPRNQPLSTHEIGSIRMGTTVATNALLERDGAKLALVITKGFGDLLAIGNQARPNIFDLTCEKPSLLYERVVEVDERVVLEQYYPPALAQQYERQMGVTGEYVLILQKPALEIVREQLQELLASNIKALAICTMHSYTYNEHELMIGKLAEEMGFEQVSLSSLVMPMVKIVSRYV